MADTNYSDVVNTAREYYNSTDADNFYHTVWGGEDIHIGLYFSDADTIFDASRRTVERMVEKIASKLTPDARVLDLGAGYGGSMRYIAKTYGCKCVALNLSEVENERDRAKNEEQKLDHLIDVVDGSFENLPYDADTFDVIWSQDAILHSGDRKKVFEEIARVAKPGAEVVFTDPMQSDNADPAALQPIYDRIHLANLGSPGVYIGMAKELGWEDLGFEEMKEQLINHYSRVRAELDTRNDELTKVVSADYVDRMKVGLGHWVEGGQKGNLTWGIFHFRVK